MSKGSAFRLTMYVALWTFGTLTCAHAEPWGVTPGENMVMLPYDPSLMPPDNGVIVPAEDTMVMLPDLPPPAPRTSYVEAGVNWHDVSNTQGDWFGQFGHAEVQTDPDNRWIGHLLHQRAFHDTGSFVSLGNNHRFDDLWSSDVSLGMGSDVSFLPRFRADAALNRRWLDKRNLITSFGTTFTKAADTYHSIGLFSSFAYYFENPWVVQGGARVDRSMPGAVYAPSAFGALSYGYGGQYFLTASGTYSREAYQLIGTNRLTHAFYSHNLGLNWRQWLGEDWGFNLGTEFYRNPAYHRLGGSFSLFKEF